MISKSYVIINVDDVTDDMVAESGENEDSLRYSLDCTCVILKFGTKFPSSVKGVKKYTHSELLQYIDDNADGWVVADE